MTNLELKQLRQLLFLSQPEAAEHIAKAETRTWQRWEKGDRSIPSDIVEQMQMLALTRTELLSVEPDLSHYNYQYFDSLDEYEKVSGVRSIIKWRLSQSIAASLLAEATADSWRQSEIINNED